MAQYALLDTMSFIYPFGLGMAGGPNNLTATVEGKTINTTALYGYLKSIVSVMERGQIPIICLDSKFNLRKTENPNYKANRVGPSIDNLYEQLEFVQKIAASCNLNILSAEGYEADDLIISAAENLKGQHQVQIYSGDLDLLQAVDTNVSWVRSVGQKSINYINRENYAEVLQIPYNTIVLKKATVGDTADNIKGIKGFGAKAFDKLIVQMTADGVDFSTIRRDKLEADLLRQYFSGDQLTQALHALSDVLPLTVAADIDHTARFNAATFIWWMEKLQMQSLIDRMQKFGA